MENRQLKTWVNLSFLALAILLGYVLFTLGLKGIATFDLETKIKNAEWILRGVAVVLGLALFVSLNRNRKVSTFTTEVFEELTRVTWPTQKDTTTATILVIIMVLISGFVLGLWDYLLTWAIQRVF